MINPKDTVQEALLKAKAKRVYLEGNLVKILSKQFPAEVKEYIEECKTKDKQARKKRLDVTKQVQSQSGFASWIFAMAGPNSPTSRGKKSFWITSALWSRAKNSVHFPMICGAL